MAVPLEDLADKVLVGVCVCVNSLHVGCTFLARAKWDPTTYLDSPMLVGVCA